MNNEIAYQNKDITSKIFAKHFSGKSLKVYGVDLPKIKQVLPTNLPVIQANELRMDNLFLLEDNTFLLIDYESVYQSKNKLKYINYILRVMECYMKEYKEMKIRMLVIYTADVREENTSNTLDVLSLKLELEQAFLSKLSSNQIKLKLTDKIKNNQTLTDEELMEYIILPLTYQGIEEKKEAIQELFILAKEIEEEETQLFLLSGILVFTDKVIDAETAKNIKEWIRMTKVARLFEEEKEEAVKRAIEQTAIETAMETAMETAIEMLKDGDSIEKIVRCNKSLSVNDVEKLKKKFNL